MLNSNLLNNHKKVIIIGGGLAGISAAIALKKANIPFLLIEASSCLGGKASSWANPVTNEVLELGPHSFLGHYASLWQLIDDLNLQEEVAELGCVYKTRYIAFENKLYPLRPSPWCVLTSGLFDFKTRVQFFKEYLSANRFKQTHHERSEAELNNESYADFMSRHLGERLSSSVGQAVVNGVFAGDIHKLSLKAAMPALSLMEKEHGSIIKALIHNQKNLIKNKRHGSFFFKNGFKTLGVRALEFLNEPQNLSSVVLNTQVTGIDFKDNHYFVQLQDGSQIDSQYLIIATEAFKAGELIQNLLPLASQTLQSFLYEPIVLLHLRERQSESVKLPKGFGYLSAPSPSLNCLGMMFTKDMRAVSSEADLGRRYFSVFMAGAHRHDQIDWSDELLFKAALSDLKILIKQDAEPLLELVHVERYAKAVYQPNIGHDVRCKTLISQLSHHNIALAGSYFGSAAMKDAVQSGTEAGQAAVRYFSKV